MQIWNKKIQSENRKNRFKAWLLLSLTIFLSLSLYSYNPLDSSLNSFGLAIKVTNVCGFVGASLADILYQSFGLSAWLLILTIFWLAYKFFRNQSKEIHIYSFIFFFVFLFSFTGLSHLYFPKMLFFQEKISIAGTIGQVMVQVLNPLFHKTGTAVVLWSCFFMIFIFYGQNLLFFSFSGLVNFFKKNLIASFKSLILKTWFFILKQKKLPKWIFDFCKLCLSFLKKQFHVLQKKIIKTKTIQTDPDQTVIKNTDSTFPFKETRFFDEVKTSDQNTKNDQDIKTKSDDTKTKSDDTKTQANQTVQKSLKSDEGSIPEKTDNSLIDFDSFILPTLNILSDNPLSSQKMQKSDVQALSVKLLNKLHQFSIKGHITTVKTGPAVILFEFKPEDHIKVSRIKEMESDLSMALSSESVRIIAPIPGKDVVGIEASKAYRETVYLKKLLQEPSIFEMSLPLILGHSADNLIGITDLARIPHLLVAGTTGSGKSIFIISFITTLLFRHTPKTLRLILIDPKQVDLSSFKDVPHLLSPIITDSNKTVTTLQWAIIEMEKRYRSIAVFGARDSNSFNEKIKNLSNKDLKHHENINLENPPENQYYFTELPLICIIIEEFGDLMADRTIHRSVENAVVRLAQKARASGIHLVLAMQSPRKDVVTGLIKTNIPGRISFKVASGTDSRVILDEVGAERLLSHGDMLFLEPGNSKSCRYHGPYIREEDVLAIGNYWRSQAPPLYEKSLIKNSKSSSSLNSLNFNTFNKKTDPLYNEILAFVKNSSVVSASFLQRKFCIGYPRAGRIIETLFEEGYIGPPVGSKPREVLHKK